MKLIQIFQIRINYMSYTFHVLRYIYIYIYDTLQDTSNVSRTSVFKKSPFVKFSSKENSFDHVLLKIAVESKNHI